MKQELLYWGIGFSAFGAFQSIGLGAWGMGFVSIGILNLLLRRRPGLLAGRRMLLVNGLTLFGSGAWSLMMALSAGLYGGMNIPFGIGHLESNMIVGGMLLLRGLQISAGLYGFGRFKQYAATQQLLSGKKVTI